jgi:tetratricopeptide (TPR) repeat protein
MNGHFQQLLTELARQDLKARLVARPDACPACRKLHGRIFDPLEAPSIPVEECLTPPCRCRYEGCDPRSTVDGLLRAGITAVKEQRLEEARELLYQVIDLDERNDQAWFWLSGVAEGMDERITCLVNVLTINPDHEWAREGLGYLLAKRREVGSGDVAAKKIKEVREAIGQLRYTQEKLAPLREWGPGPAEAADDEWDEVHAGERPRVRELVEKEEGGTRFFLMGALYVLLAMLILVLVGVALRYAGIL